LSKTGYFKVPVFIFWLIHWRMFIDKLQFRRM